MALSRVKKLQAMVHICSQDPGLVGAKELSLLRAHVENILSTHLDVSGRKEAEEEEALDIANSDERDFENDEGSEILEADQDNTQEKEDENVRLTSEVLDQAEKRWKKHLILLINVTSQKPLSCLQMPSS